MKSAGAVVIAEGRTRAADYVSLAKPRLNMLVVASTLAGYVMGDGEMANAARVVAMLAGTGLVAGGASAFNQVYERETDALMRRTRLRPMADGRMNVQDALVYAAALSLAGLATLAVFVNPLSAAVAFATLLSYVAIYTPLKLRTSLATVIGAIPGALPPVIGWAAATNGLGRGAWVLFGIVFLWQLPHFLAIAWMYREDYARAGFPMLPVIEPDGRSTARQSVLYAAALLPLSLAPTLVGIANTFYFVAAFALTLGFLALTVRFARTRSSVDARRVFFGSILYLPILWILMIAGRT
ncbi:MAG TPA: heme o synthase [Vicinamibacterales bacterium]|jgi:protoheme IX farnesyltransferase|nr:heme o synthase [Vicinamibacterales bacterium]